LDITLSGVVGRVVSPTGASSVDLAQTFVVGQSLIGEVVRLVPRVGALVNFNGQQVLLELGQRFAPGQTLTATVAQVSPALVLQLTDHLALPTLAEASLLSLSTPQEGQGGVLTAAQLKAYLTAHQSFGQTVTVLEHLLTSHPLLHDIAPELTQALRDTLAVLQQHAESSPDAAQLKEQVDRSGLNYENKVQRALTGESPTTATALAKDLKGQLLELSQRLERLSHTGTDAHRGETAIILEQVKRAVDALEFQQLSNQFALQEHQPLVLPLINPFASPVQTTQLTVHRDGGQAGQQPAEQERYTVALSLDLSGLGALHIEATVQGSAVFATFQVEDLAVAEFLRAATPELSARLQELGLQAGVACEVQEHVAQEGEGPLPRSLTRAVKLVDVKI